MISKFIIAVILVVIIITGTGIYYSASMSVQPEISIISTTPVTLRVLSHINYTEKIDNTKFFVIAGVVQNNQTDNVCYVNVTATFFNANNTVIAVRTGVAELKIIKPGGKTPFNVYLLLNLISDSPTRYELAASGFKTNDEPENFIQVLNVHNETIHGYFTIGGEIYNYGIKKAYSVKAICTYYDSKGNILHMSKLHVASEIEGGAKIPFQISTMPHQIDPAAYDLFIVVHHYEMLPITNLMLLAFLVLTAMVVIIYMKKRGW